MTILAPFAGLLMSSIADFRANNPQCAVVVDASEDLARFEYEEAHIELRVGSSLTTLIMWFAVLDGFDLIFMPTPATFNSMGY